MAQTSDPIKKNSRSRPRNVHIVEVIFMSSEFGVTLVVGRVPSEILRCVNAVTQGDPARRLTSTHLSRGIHCGAAESITRDRRHNRYWIRGYGIRAWMPQDYTAALRQFHQRRAIDAGKIAARQESLVTTLVTQQRELQRRETQRGILASLTDQAVASTVRAL